MKTIMGSHHGIEEVERLLELTLRPVSPRPEFIKHLRRQIMRTNHPARDANSNKNSHYVLLAVASIASTTFLVLTGARTVISLMSFMSMVQLLKKESAGKRMEASRVPA